MILTNPIKLTTPHHRDNCHQTFRQYETRYKIPNHIFSLTERTDKNNFQVDNSWSGVNLFNVMMSKVFSCKCPTLGENERVGRQTFKDQDKADFDKRWDLVQPSFGVRNPDSRSKRNHLTAEDQLAIGTFCNLSFLDMIIEGWRDGWMITLNHEICICNDIA